MCILLVLSLGDSPVELFKTSSPPPSSGCGTHFDAEACTSISTIMCMCRTPTVIAPKNHISTFQKDTPNKVQDTGGVVGVCWSLQLAGARYTFVLLFLYQCRFCYNEVTCDEVALLANTHLNLQRHAVTTTLKTELASSFEWFIDSVRLQMRNGDRVNKVLQHMHLTNLAGPHSLCLSVSVSVSVFVTIWVSVSILCVRNSP